MSNAEDKLVDEYLSGGTPFSTRYRRIPAAEVAPELDRAVLERARTNSGVRANDSAYRPRSKLLWRMGPPLAIAATAVLALTVILRSNTELQAPTVTQYATSTDRADTGQGSLSNTGTQDELRKELSPAASTPTEIHSRPSLSMVPAPPAIEPRLELQQNFAPSPPPEVTRQKMAERSVATKEAEAFQPRRSLERDKTQTDNLQELKLSANQKPLDVATQSASGAAPSAPPAAAKTEAPLEARSNAEASRSQPETTNPTEFERIVVTGSMIRGAPQDSALPVDVGGYREMPSDWLRHIRQLRRERRNDEADHEWRDFVQHYPKFRVRVGDTARPVKK